MSRTHHHLRKRQPPHPRFWMSTPGWWIRMWMNKPQRRLGALWQRETERTPVSDLDLQDTPNVTRKPHKYFW